MTFVPRCRYLHERQVRGLPITVIPLFPRENEATLSISDGYFEENVSVKLFCEDEQDHNHEEHEHEAGHSENGQDVSHEADEKGGAEDVENREMQTPEAKLKALRTTRILTKFTPSCPSPSSIPSDLDLAEEFTVGLNIRLGICQGVPVPLPLGFYDEVDHVSFELVYMEQTHLPLHYNSAVPVSSPSPSSRPSLGARAGNNSHAPNLEVCTVRLFEKPGCGGFDKPLIQREFGVGAGIGGSSRCVKRSTEFVRLGEVFVRIDCTDGIRPYPDTGDIRGELQQVGGNGTAAGAWGSHINSTTTTSTTTTSGIGAVLGRWQRRRMSLLGR
ncbi:hypothetical protein BDV11DRAFT_166403 [Aspergillus similis]